MQFTEPGQKYPFEDEFKSLKKLIVRFTKSKLADVLVRVGLVIAISCAAFYTYHLSYSYNPNYYDPDRMALIPENLVGVALPWLYEVPPVCGEFGIDTLGCFCTQTGVMPKGFPIKSNLYDTCYQDSSEISWIVLVNGLLLTWAAVGIVGWLGPKLAKKARH